MSESIETKLNYFREKKAELQKAEMDLRMRAGQFNDEFNGWLKERGVVERNGQFDVIDIIAEFAPRT